MKVLNGVLRCLLILLLMSVFLGNTLREVLIKTWLSQSPLCVSEKQLQGVPSDTQEEEEDDLYTYEVPPSKGQSKQMVPALAENIYLVPSQVVSLSLDRPALRRFSEPHNLLQPKSLPFLSKPGADADDSSDGTFNFLAIERALQKGMMKQSVPLPLPLSARRGSLPVLGPSGPQAKALTSRDPLPALKDDEEETQEESIYVESSVSRKVLPCPTPVPPVQPLKQARPATTPSGPQKAFAENLCKAVCLKSGSVPEDFCMQNKAWYAGSCDRHTAEAALLRFNKDSAYLVRQSSRHGWNQPFTLAVLFKKHVYNIPIRYLESSHQYTLGKDGRSHEELFDSVSSIIQSYSERPLVLVDGSTSAKEQTCLLFPVKP
ncbi:SH2 domain-containing protein 6 isoform X2 [Podarcis raffonei]|uniref:SH2 domain-containing protein 6 isoform X2 n=1 Tax=Podarcis raffonei TaxID=65483 RepID=UPI0023295633|nr:SH2 domain-containing protein 6 isoform X2 [Podarcis raffonei]